MKYSCQLQKVSTVYLLDPKIKHCPHVFPQRNKESWHETAWSVTWAAERNARNISIASAHMLTSHSFRIFMVLKGSLIEMIHENINKVWQTRALYEYHRCATNAHKFLFIPRCITCLKHGSVHVSSFSSCWKTFLWTYILWTHSCLFMVDEYLGKNVCWKWSQSIYRSMFMTKLNYLIRSPLISP